MSEKITLGPIPRLDAKAFPEAERETVSHIGILLENLAGYVIDFNAAYRLFQVLGKEIEAAAHQNADHQMLVKWLFIAARDGAMQIYHFAQVIEGIRESQNTAPTLKGLVDHATLKLANKKFLSYFPSFRDVRDAVAHSADLSRTKARRDRNAFTA